MAKIVRLCGRIFLIMGVVVVAATFFCPPVAADIILYYTGAPYTSVASPLLGTNLTGTVDISADSLPSNFTGSLVWTPIPSPPSPPPDLPIVSWKFTSASFTVGAYDLYEAQWTWSITFVGGVITGWSLDEPYDGAGYPSGYVSTHFGSNGGGDEVAFPVFPPQPGGYVARLGSASSDTLGIWTYLSSPLPIVPEPASGASFFLGLLGFAIYLGNRKKDLDR